MVKVYFKRFKSVVENIGINLIILMYKVLEELKKEENLFSFFLFYF